MKKSIIVLTLTLAVAACDQTKKPTAEELEQEVERRVEAKLAEERRADEERKLAEKAEEIRLREQTAAEREAAAAQREQAARDAENAARVREEQARQAAIVPPATPPPNDSYDPNYIPSQPLQPAGDTYNVTYNTFYESLDEDGEWFETDDYGYVFRPYIVVRDNAWRPYCDGRWVYTDHGWTWLSNERFGWATYHYGRWTRLVGTGWVWVPGTEWAPSWVSWRTGDDVIGWAPLPPEARFGSGDLDFDAYAVLGAGAFCFVNTRDFNRPSVVKYAYHAPDNVTIINRTKNVTRIVKNKTTKVVINQGPQIEEIEKKANVRIERAKLEKKQGGGKGQTGWKNGVVEVAIPDQKPEKPNAAKPMPDRVSKKLGKSKIETDNPGTVQTMPARVPGGTTVVPMVSGTPTPSPTPDQAEAIEKEQRRLHKLREEQLNQKNQRPAAPVQSTQPAPVQPANPGNTQTLTPSAEPDSSAAQAEAIQNEQRRVRKLQAEQDAQKEQRRQQRLQEEQQQRQAQEAQQEQRRRDLERAQRQMLQQQQQQQPRAAQPQPQPAAPQQQIQRKQAQPTTTPTDAEVEAKKNKRDR